MVKRVSRIEKVEQELHGIQEVTNGGKIPFTYVTNSGYKLGRALSELRKEAKLGKISSADINRLDKLGARIGPDYHHNPRYPFAKTVEDIKKALLKNGGQRFSGDELCSDGVPLSLRIDQYRASFRSGRINPKHKEALEALGIDLNPSKRKAAYTSQQVKDNIQLFIKYFKKYRKQHSHGYFEKDFVIDGLNMRDWSERIRRISKCEKSNTPSPEVYQALIDAGFLMTHRECFIEKMLLGIENYKNLNGKLPRRRDRNEFDEPVGTWLRKVRDRLADSTMPSSMRSRAIKLVNQ